MLQTANAQTAQDSAGALEIALAKVTSETTPTPELKIEYMKATRSSKGKTWEFIFRDGEIQYKVDLNIKGTIKFSKNFDEDENNPEFWATLPVPSAVQLDTEYLNLAKDVVNKFNSTFTAQDRAIIEYKVCDAPKPGQVSKYKSGCKNDKPQQRWEVAIQVKSSSGEFFRQIEFQNGEPVIFSRINVFGNW